jgi:hypothetical protein
MSQHRPPTRACLWAGLVLTAACAAIVAVPHTGMAGRAPRSVQQRGPVCLVTATYQIQPPVLEVGQRAQVGLDLRGQCPPQPRHVALVLDKSDAARTRLNALKQAARNLVQALPIGGGRGTTETGIGVVSYADVGQVEQVLTTDRQRLLAAIDSLSAGGAVNLGGGVQTATEMVYGATRRLRPPVARDVLVIMATTSQFTGRANAAVQRAKSLDIGIITSCVGAGCAEHDMQALASDASLYFDAANTRAIADAAVAWGANRGPTDGIANVFVFQQLARQLTVISATGVPTPIHVGRTITWDVPSFPAQGLHMDFEIQALEPGTAPLLELGYVRLFFGQATADVAIVAPSITVRGDTPTPTASSTLRPRTNTPTPGPTATQTPTIVWRWAFLPHVGKRWMP